MCLGIPAQIIEIVDAETFTVKVELCGVKRLVNARCIVGQAESVDTLLHKWVLVHVGFAMSIIDELEAQRTLELLRQLGELDAREVFSSAEPEPGR